MTTPPTATAASTRARSLPTRPPLALLRLSALLAAAPVVAQGFDWDHPDGLGVRYLLYDKVSRTEFKPKDQPGELVAMFHPKQKSDWVRINGTELAWGVHVYEFEPQDGAAGDAAAGNSGLGRFLRDRDPRRTFREFRVEDKPIKAKGNELRYWEFVDTWRPFLEVLDRPQPRGPFRYAVAPELGLRWLCDKTMEYVDPFVGSDGDNCYGRLHPASSQWIRVDGLPLPVAWMLRVYVFPDMPRERSSSGRDRLVDSFAEFITAKDPSFKTQSREFSARGEAAADAATPCELWRWVDTPTGHNRKSDAQTWGVAAVYEVDGKQVALVGESPSNERDTRPEPMAALERMVRSAERWQGEAKAPGFSFYNLAASCRAGDKEVGIVVHLPMGTDPRPDRKLFGIARKMVESIEPAVAK